MAHILSVILSLVVEKGVIHILSVILSLLVGKGVVHNLSLILSLVVEKGGGSQYISNRLFGSRERGWFTTYL